MRVVSVTNFQLIESRFVAGVAVLSNGRELTVCERLEDGPEGVRLAPDNEDYPVSDTACLVRALYPHAGENTIAAISEEVRTALYEWAVDHLSVTGAAALRAAPAGSIQRNDGWSF